MISIAHKIELVPNNKQKTYFRKAFGCARLAYNWGIAEWQRRYKAGEKCSFIALNNAFNAIKGEQYPFVYEVTKYACQQSFRNVASAYQKFFDDLKRGFVSYPKFKKKKDNKGKFYICGDAIRLSDTNKNSKVFKKIAHNERLKRQYLKVPNLGYVKMTQRIRFIGKINSVIISQEGDRFFAAFSMQITKDEYKRTHPRVKEIHKEKLVGIDLGLKTSLVLSDGISIESPYPLKQHIKKIKKLNRQLDKRTYAKTKQERLSGIKKSNNYRKISVKLANEHRKIANIRRNFTQKVTTILSTHYSEIALENLNLSGMIHNHKLARSESDVSFGDIIRKLEYKSHFNEVKIVRADRFFPSSKRCSSCGNVKRELRLKERVYRCEKCGIVIDRDFNASLNLLGLLNNSKIGTSSPELTPVDLTALLSRFARNGITTSKVEAGRQQRCKIL